MEKALRIRSSFLAGCLFVGLLPAPAQSADLKPETVRGFDHYVQLLETRMDDDLRAGKFLYMDRLPSEKRVQIDAQIRRGDYYIEQLGMLENGWPVPVPSGLIHHWVGIEFIPGATYSQTIQILLDFDRQAEIYKPDVQQSKLLATDGYKSKVFLQYFKKSLVTAVLNASFDSEYRPLGNSRGEIRSYSTRIAEVQNPGKPEEKELPVGKDHGYLWRLNSYWTIEEKDGGVYVQIESVGLSRRVPPLLAWLINPIVRSLSRAVMANLLTGTRKAVIGNSAPMAQSNGEWGAEVSSVARFTRSECPKLD
jgi:hypothetical protein